MENVANLTKEELDAMTRAERYLVYTEMAADAGGGQWLLEGRMMARYVLELGGALGGERSARRELQRRTAPEGGS